MTQSPPGVTRASGPPDGVSPEPEVSRKEPRSNPKKNVGDSDFENEEERRETLALLRDQAEDPELAPVSSTAGCDASGKAG